MRALALSFVFALFPLALAGCDVFSGGGHEGPYTLCELNYTLGDAGLRGLGESCESDDDCQYAECIKPGDGGNLINTDFGFCSRGCDCDDKNDSRLSLEEKADLLCVYPPGEHKHRRFVVPRCNTLADCQALDPKWTSCRQIEVGGTSRVCHAD